MSLVIEDLKVPVHLDPNGTARVGRTRVTLHTVVGAFKKGAAPEQIVLQFDVLKLRDVYAVLAYYLSHQAEVDQHLREYEEEGDRIRQEIEATCPSKGLREKLLTRKKEKESQDAQLSGR